MDRLVHAGLRAIAANGIGTVGRDGRRRVVMEWVDAQGELANLLREVAGKIPMHSAQCAARLSPVALCDCVLSGKGE
jgi:hypothetical protein